MTRVDLPTVGDWYQSVPGRTPIRCIGYSAPFDPETKSGGEYLGEMSPGTYFGPVERYDVTNVFVSVLVRGWWINVWKAADGRRPDTSFAFKVPDETIADWKRRGWQDFNTMMVDAVMDVLLQTLDENTRSRLLGEGPK